MSKKAGKLIELARETFDDLSETETKMLRAAANGKECDVRRDESEPKLTKDSEPGCWDEWYAHRVVRAEVLRWLCVDPEAKSLVDPRGVQLGHARIMGNLDLDGIDISFRLVLVRCALPEELTLRFASMPLLSLGGSHTGPITGDGLTTTGSVNLRDGFTAHGEVRLPGATIGGDLDCTGGIFENKGDEGPRRKGEQRYALNADSLTTTGSVNLCGGFTAHGEVRFVGGKIGGDLDCTGGTFENKGGRALTADGLTTTGYVNLGGGFRAHGEVRLPGARIGGNLDCPKGTFKNEGGLALHADGLTTTGSVQLRPGFTAHGEVRLLGAKIGGNLDCIGGTFDNRGDKRPQREGEQRYALNADGLATTGSVYLRDGFTARGEVRFLSAKIGGNLSCICGTFENEGGDALILQGTEVRQALLMRGIKRWKGEVDLTRALIGYLVDDESGWPDELILTGCRYDGIYASSPCDAKRRLKWLERHDRTVEKLQDRDPHARFDPQPYRHLARVLQQQGHESDAKKIMIAAAVNEWRDSGLGRMIGVPHDWVRRVPEWLAKGARGIGHGFEWAGRSILWLFIGHGYRRWLPLAWLFVMFALGWLLFWLNADSMQAWGVQDGNPYPSFNSFAFTLDTLIPLVNLHQESFWQPQPGWLRGYMWVHIGMGWFLTTLFVVGLTGLVRRVTTGEGLD